MPDDKGNKRTHDIRIKVSEDEYALLKEKANLVGMGIPEFIRATSIKHQQRFSLARFPGQEGSRDGTGLLALPDSRYRSVQKRFNVTPAEDHLLRRAARNAGMTQSRFIVERTLRAPMYFLGDPEFFKKYFTELNRQGTNFNQIAHALNTIALIGDLPDIKPERFNQLFTETEELLRTVKKPMTDALVQTQDLMRALQNQVKETTEKRVDC